MLLAEHGATFQGVIVGPRQRLILFSDPDFASTLALPESEFSTEAVVRRLAENRRAFRTPVAADILPFRFFIRHGIFQYGVSVGPARVLEYGDRDAIA